MKQMTSQQLEKMSTGSYDDVWKVLGTIILLKKTFFRKGFTNAKGFTVYRFRQPHSNSNINNKSLSVALAVLMHFAAY